MPQQIDPEEEIKVAEEALRQGEISHALIHAAHVVSTSPTDAGYLALLDSVLDADPEPLSLFTTDEQGVMPFFLAGAKAYAYRRLNRTNDALFTLYQVIQQHPQVPYILWAIEWIKDAEAEHTVSFMAAWIAAIEEEKLDIGQAVPTIEHLPTLVDAALANREGLPAEMLSFASAGLLRRVGFGDKALGLARQSYAQRPSYLTALALGAALRDSHPEIALTAYRAASEYKPDELAPWIDIGNLSWQLGKLDDALAAYSRICAKTPEHPWAYPSKLMVEFDLTHSVETMKRVGDYAKRHPENDRVFSLLEERHQHYTGATLPAPSEAIIDMARQVIDQFGLQSGMSIQSASSGPESPSAIASAIRAVPGITWPAFGKIPKPNPLQPRKADPFALWKFEGHQAKPAVVPPTPEITKKILWLAIRPYNYRLWKIWAGQTGLTPGDALQVLAGMVFPSPMPRGTMDWDWTQKWVLASAFITAYLNPDLLFITLAGPMDWSVWASAIALSGVAQSNPDVEQKLIPELQATIHHWEKVATPEFLYPLYLALLTNLPNLEASVREGTEKKLQAILGAGT